MLIKQEILLGKGTWVESRRVREPGELLCRVARSLAFYGDGICFWVVFQPIILIQSLFWWHTHQPRWMLARGILGSGQTRGVSF